MINRIIETTLREIDPLSDILVSKIFRYALKLYHWYKRGKIIEPCNIYQMSHVTSSVVMRLTRHTEHLCLISIFPFIYTYQINITNVVIIKKQTRIREILTRVKTISYRERVFSIFS